jgi:hypothetical protein
MQPFKTGPVSSHNAQAHLCCCCFLSPGVDACIRVAAQAPVPGSDPAQDLADFINLLSAGLANATTAADADNHTGMLQGCCFLLTRGQCIRSRPYWLRQLHNATHSVAGSRLHLACVRHLIAGQAITTIPVATAACRVLCCAVQRMATPVELAST